MSSESREEMFRRKREMEALSLVLEKLINDEPIDSMQGDKDTLPSKIRHQMIRLSDKMRGNEEQLIKDRDEIKGLISEIAHQLRVEQIGSQPISTPLQYRSGEFVF